MSPLIEQFTYFSNTALIDSNSKIFFAQSCHGLIFFFLWPSSMCRSKQIVFAQHLFQRLIHHRQLRTVTVILRVSETFFTDAVENSFVLQSVQEIRWKVNNFGETPPRNNNTTHIRGFPSLTHVPRIFIFFNLNSDIMYCVYHINTKIKGDMV